MQQTPLDHSSLRGRSAAEKQPREGGHGKLARVDLDGLLPEPVVVRLVERLGQPIAGVQHAEGTFASDFAAVLTLADSSTVFAKASCDPDRRADYETEASIGESLPTGLSTPRFRGSLRQDRWIVLWFDAVSGSHPVQPWAPTVVDAVVAAIKQNSRMLTPCPVPSLRTIPEMVASAGIFTVWRDLLAGRPRALAVGDLDQWTLEHLPQLARWEARWAHAVAGDTLCHFDPRADNFIIDRTSGACWVLDWSRGSVGAHWVDLVTFAVTLAGDGYDAEQVFTRAGGGVDADDVNAHLAVLAGYWNNAVHQPQGSKTSGLIDYQQRSAAGSLAWLRQRTAGRS